MFAPAVPAAPGPGPRWLADAGQLALAALLALVLLPISWPSVAEGGVGPVWAGALHAALLALHLSVFAARRWPVPAYAFAAAAMLVLVLAPELGGPTAEAAGGGYVPVFLPSSFCFFVVLYASSAHARRPWPQISLAVGLTGCLVALVRVWGHGLPGVAEWVFQLMLITAALGGTLSAWALGRFRSIRSAWVAELADRAAADERRRIAREMHDVVAHSLAVVVSHAEAGRMVVAGHPERAPEILDTIGRTGREALQEMRGLLGVLRDEAASTSSQPGIDELPALVERVRAAGLDVEYSGVIPPGGSPVVSLTAYRIVQEALTNVARHGRPQASARVRLEVSDGHCVVEVLDDGRLPTPAGPAGPAGSGSSVGTGSPAGTTEPAERRERAEPGRGLTGMRERADAVGGELKYGPTDEGWRVWARLPWGERDE